MGLVQIARGMWSSVFLSLQMNSLVKMGGQFHFSELFPFTEVGLIATYQICYAVVNESINKHDVNKWLAFGFLFISIFLFYLHIESHKLHFNHFSFRNMKDLVLEGCKRSLSSTSAFFTWEILSPNWSSGS